MMLKNKVGNEIQKLKLNYVFNSTCHAGMISRRKINTISKSCLNKQPFCSVAFLDLGLR